jgi:hypothetical protein
MPIFAIPYRRTDSVSLTKFGVETIIASSVGHFLMLEILPNSIGCSSTF